MARSIEPEAAWNAVQLGFAEILDLRTEIERRRHGAPPRARPVSLVKHIASPEGPGSIYLCQHAIRSKATLRRGAAEVAGGFAAWKEAGLPVEEVDQPGLREQAAAAALDEKRRFSWKGAPWPIAKTDSCQVSHLGYVMSGRMRVFMDDGSESEIGPGDVVAIPPGHDAEIVGDEACVMLDFGEFGDYAKRT